MQIGIVLQLLTSVPKNISILLYESFPLFYLQTAYKDETQQKSLSEYTHCT